MRRLSRPIADLKMQYDAVVVGSGYGAGVAASRLARSGLRVAVLERGREFRIGEFPDRLAEAREQMQTRIGDRKIGSDLGLFDLRLGRDMHVLLGCGLGGGSLINANVALPPDERVWDDPVWPKELAEGPTRQIGFTRAREMLQPVPFPGHRLLPKLKALETAGQAIGKTAQRPPINVTFQRHVNHANVEQPECTLCGDCCSGCNVGAKNTVQVTYLADAVNHGAEIFTELRVSHVKHERGRWRVHFEPAGNARDKFGSPEQSLSAEIVVLGAGTLGSTEILMRSREHGLNVSAELGQRFTGNGDVLAFAYNNDVPINGVGFGHPPTANPGPVGPCIAGMIDLRNSEKLEDGIVIEEGAIPSGIASILPTMMAGGAAAFGVDTDFGVEDEINEAARVSQSLIFGAYKGAVNHTQTFLVMAHDGASGVMTLNDDRLEVSWPGVTDLPIFEAIGEKLYAATAATGGTFTRNPLTTTFLGNNLITVHPLGGCAMGSDSERGVVNHKCQVFDTTPGASPKAVHKGLYVCDGAVMPRSLGVNPLLTISALAERAMIHLAADYGLTFDSAAKKDAPVVMAGPIDPDAPKSAGVEFTERMSGFIAPEPNITHETAYAKGKQGDHAFSFTVTVMIDDVDHFIDDRAHPGRLIGTVDCPALSPEPLDIFNGTFNLMRADKDSVETKRFEYAFSLAARDGKTYRFKGIKIVRSDAQLDLWRDTTQLFVDLFEGLENDAGPVARGVLRIKPADFARQMQTIKGTDGRDAADRMRAAAKFGRFFGRELFDTYGGILVRSARHDSAVQRKKRNLRVPEPEVHLVKTQDGKLLRLTRYQGGTKGPVMFAHGLGVSSLIFSIDTIDTNMLEYMVTAGYDCWLLDFRASVDLVHATEQWTADDVAAYDYPAAVAKIRAVTGAPSVQVIAHCFGATTFSMAMLAGLEGVRSAVISQISTDYVVPFYPQRMLAHLRAPTLFDLIGLDVVNARATTDDPVWQRAVDWMLRVLAPVPRKERNQSATSARITALYGRLYDIDQLNKDTFQHGLPEMFGEANIAAFRQLALFARKGTVLDKNGEDAYLPHVNRMAIPTLFIHGANNACFRPESTVRTVRRLTEANGNGLYERREIPGHGHIDCIFGKNAAIAVFPLIRRHLDATA